MPAGVEVLVVLGSNIEPRANLPLAVTRLRGLLRVAAVSGAWQSEPHGAPGTPLFLNAAVRGRSELPPVELRRALRRIEVELGRVRTDDPNAPRTIDLDLVSYGDVELDDPETGLRLPDPDVGRRAYLALPLAEVAPDRRLPGSRETLAAAARRLVAADPAPPRRVSVDL